eukprot:TRINITY_DN3909_c1_g1_i5.p1 TRINITY_DN3909_c1_g1~~TRINITY_DN3909_c1_g1_i5.p1  ORF type:complete len:613 (-),score=78.11 TRINITY_DN3909_c1_g1_i5:180-1775(-)
MASQAAKRALISVSDKTGIVELSTDLISQGYEILSTGGTASAISSADLPVTKVEDVTRFPEMLDGRVKTLHPKIHGGLLAIRDNAQHVSSMEEHGIAPIDIVIVNLYPFRQTVTKDPKSDFEMCVENIDIGGPAMIRAAAKNHKYVTVIVDPEDYGELVQQLKEESQNQLNFRKLMAWKAFQHCATYDTWVSEWFWGQVGQDAAPPQLTVPLTLKAGLRYGENPHQQAAFYGDQSLEECNQGGIANAIQHHGKEMSYNNYLDADAAYQCVCDFKEPACVIVKHTNPCGVAVRQDLLEAYRLAVQADPVSAFGGIVAFNRPIDEQLANEIRQYRSPTDNETRMFYEIVVAPSFIEAGLETLKGKSKTLRILEAPQRSPSGRGLRQIGAGWLYQSADSLTPDDMEFKVVSQKSPTPEMMKDLKFAWLCVKHVKSNAITVAKDGRLLGMGSGQPNRVKSTQIAMEKAGEELQGAVLASDAFFPFSWGDAVEMACQAGVVAIVHPGGSVRDEDCVDCCDKYGVALVLTGHRHFKH